MTLREALDILELNPNTLDRTVLETSLKKHLEGIELRNVMRLLEAYRKANAFINPTLATHGDVRVTMIDEPMPDGPPLNIRPAAKRLSEDPQRLKRDFAPGSTFDESILKAPAASSAPVYDPKAFETQEMMINDIAPPMSLPENKNIEIVPGEPKAKPAPRQSAAGFWGMVAVGAVAATALGYFGASGVNALLGGATNAEVSAQTAPVAAVKPATPNATKPAVPNATKPNPAKPNTANTVKPVAANNQPNSLSVKPPSNPSPKPPANSSQKPPANSSPKPSTSSTTVPEVAATPSTSTLPPATQQPIAQNNPPASNDTKPINTPTQSDAAEKIEAERIAKLEAERTAKLEAPRVEANRQALLLKQRQIEEAAAQRVAQQRAARQEAQRLAARREAQRLVAQREAQRLVAQREAQRLETQRAAEQAAARRAAEQAAARRAAEQAAARAKPTVSVRAVNQGSFNAWDRAGAVLRYSSWAAIPDSVRALSPARFRAVVYVASSPATLPGLPR
jgi:hypothetical protein